MANNEYDKFDRHLTHITLLDQGESVDLDFIRAKWGVSRSCAEDYLRFLRGYYGARLVADRDPASGKKSWSIKKDERSKIADLTRAASLKFGEIALDVLRGTKYHREVQQLSRAERARLVTPSADRLDRFVLGVHRLTRGVPDYRHKRAQLDAWLDGILNHQRVRMTYQRADGELNVYTVEPLLLILYEDRLHLLSRLAATEVNRTFNLDGVQDVELLDHRFPAPSPDDVDAANIFRFSFGIFSDLGEPELIRLHLCGTARVRAEQRPLHWSQRLGEELKDGWRVVELTLAPCPEFRSHLLALVPEVRVAYPLRLMEELRARLEAGVLAMTPGS